MRKKYLVVFTGIDGSGKTTQARLLFESLKKDNIEVSFIRSKWEPFLLRPFIKRWRKRGASDSSNPESKTVNNKKRKNKLLSNRIVRILWLYAFLVDYGLQIFLKISSRMFNSGVLISDRIYYDSIIDQAVNLRENKNMLFNRLDSFWMNCLFPKPNTVLYIDCPEDVAFLRKKDDYTPNIEYLIDRRKLYLELADKYGWVKVDGTQPVDEIAVQIRKRLKI